MQYYKTTHKISVIICNGFCNGFALYPYYQHLPNKPDRLLSIGFISFLRNGAMNITKISFSLPYIMYTDLPIFFVYNSNNNRIVLIVEPKRLTNTEQHGNI